MNRRHFLTSLGAVTAASIAPLEALAQTAKKPAAPFALRFGYHAITWNGQDLQAIEEIAAAGFKGIQLRASAMQAYGDKPAALTDLLAKHGLTFVALSSGNVSSDPAKRDETIALHAKNAAFVKAVGGLYLQVTDERPRGRAVTAEDYTRMGQTMTEIGKRAADLGIGLGYHNHMHNLGEKPEEVAAVLAAADPAVVKLELDIAHYTQGGGDPVEAATKYRDRLLFVHLKDVISPVPGDTRDPARSYKFVELGQGKVNIPGVIDVLKKTGFRGWGIVELDGVPDKSRTPKDCMAISKKYIEETLKLHLS